ncbi:Hypothetical protein FKW44_015672, partial [Caligus rogercresseyi]
VTAVQDIAIEVNAENDNIEAVVNNSLNINNAAPFNEDTPVSNHVSGSQAIVLEKEFTPAPSIETVSSAATNIVASTSIIAKTSLKNNRSHLDTNAVLLDRTRSQSTKRVRSYSGP